MMGNNLQGRIALITGASRRQGIGAAICRALAEEGADIFFTGWHTYDQSIYSESDEDESKLLIQELQALGTRCASLEIDLSLPDTPARLLDEVEHRLGQPADAARLIAFLASDAAQWITGQVIHSNGGLR